MEHLLNQIEPVDEEAQNSFGMAVETFPQLLPRAFSTLRKIGMRMEARNVAASQPIQEEEEAEDEEVDIGNNIPEITQLLMNTLEENTPQEPWDPDLRMTLNDQLIEFLNQNTSVDPEYLVGKV